MNFVPVALASVCVFAVPAWMQAGVGIPAMAKGPVYAEAAVTVQLTVSTTSEPEVVSESAEGLRVTQTRVETRRWGNTDVLNEMKRLGLIRRVAGHSLVAVWAAWPDENPFQGSSYRFFLRQTGTRGPALIRVPSTVLALTPQDWMNARDVRLQAGKVVSGTEQFESYSEITLNLNDNSGTLLGRESGGGQYKAPVARAPAQYLPLAGRLEVDGTGAGGVIGGKFTFGPARFIAGKDFAPGALPQNTSYGGYYGYFSELSGSLSWSGGSYIWFRPAYVHYFCPLSAQLILRREVAVASGSANRQITRIVSETLSTADLISGALAAEGISDSSGWGLYLHAESDKFFGISNLDVVLGHPDGRYYSLGGGNAGLTVNGGAATARSEYQHDELVGRTLLNQANATHSRIWTLVDGGSLSLLVTGKAEIAERFGPIAEAEGQHEYQPGAATFSLFGTYSKGEESGLANVSLSIGEPLAQAAIPAGWPQRQGSTYRIEGWSPNILGFSALPLVQTQETILPPEFPQWHGSNSAMSILEWNDTESGTNARVMAEADFRITRRERELY